MKRSRKPKLNLSLVVVLLLAVLLPVIVIAAQQVREIRNKAALDTSELHYSTDLTSSEITTTYSGVPYEQQLTVAGDNARNATVTLGCNETYCADECKELEHNPPAGLHLKEDIVGTSTSTWLLWQNPTATGDTISWPITITAYAPIESETGEITDYECSVETFTLSIEDKEKNDPPACQLTYGRPNTTTVPSDQPVSFIITGSDYDDGIASAKLISTSPTGTEQILDWEYSGDSSIAITKNSTPELSMDSTETGEHTYVAEVTDIGGNTTVCQSDFGRSIDIVIPGDNGSPEFQTDPYTDSNPGTSFNTGTAYSYTVEVTDPEGDIMDYFIINETGWVNFTVNQSSPGNFTGTFSGTPSQPGSYTLAISLNDGYHDHYSTQIWVINVDSPTNDTPVITVVQPASGTTVAQNTDMTIRWTATDSNLITRFDVYLATDPSNQNTWTLIASNVAYNYDSHVWNTGVTTPGTYYIVVKATDNQNPPGIGYGISGPFTITGIDSGKEGDGETPAPGDDDEGTGEDSDDDTSDDTNLPDQYPQIVNIQPPNKSKIDETKPIISADLTASTDSTINEGSVVLEIDDSVVANDAEIGGEGEQDGSIVYTPKEPLEKTSHKISVKFEDSSGQLAQKSWTFTIGEEDTEPEDDEDVISIFGFKIGRTLALIIGISLLAILIGLMIPWLFYASWKRSQDDEWEEYDGPAGPSKPPPSDSPIISTGIHPTPPPSASAEVNKVDTKPATIETAESPVTAPHPVDTSPATESSATKNHQPQTGLMFDPTQQPVEPAITEAEIAEPKPAQQPATTIPSSPPPEPIEPQEIDLKSEKHPTPEELEKQFQDLAEEQKETEAMANKQTNSPSPKPKLGPDQVEINNGEKPVAGPGGFQVSTPPTSP